MKKDFEEEWNDFENKYKNKSINSFIEDYLKVMNCIKKKNFFFFHFSFTQKKK